MEFGYKLVWKQYVHGISRFIYLSVVTFFLQLRNNKNLSK